MKPRLVGRLLAIATFLLVAHGVHAQSNYASHANNVEYQGDGLPEQTVLDGKVTKLDDLSPVIFLNRTKAALNCAAGSMQVELKFNEPFFGIAYADYDRNSACQLAGKGSLSYKLELPLKGCGTRQEPLRVFTNNIVVRFHQALEMDGDEVITIVCRYPPPVTPLPAALPAPIQVDPVAAVPIEPPLKGIQILLIICAIMFLTLLLLGLGVSYLCLKRTTLPPHYRLPYSRSGSEITKLSGSSLGNLSVFEGVKIPRAHVPLQQACSSGSEGLPPSSDTLPSDYPSESHSDAEVEVPTRSPPLSSALSHENRAYIRDVSDSAHSEGFVESNELHLAAARLPIPVKQPTPPAFDVQVRVRRAPPSPPDRLSDSTSVRSDRNLSTIEEQREEFPPPPPPAPPGPPKRVIQQPPIYSRIVRKTAQEWDAPGVVETRRPRSIASLNTEMTDTHSITELVDDSHSKMFQMKRPAPPPPIHKVEAEINMESLEPMPETPILPVRKPEITAHMVDDVFLRTITEKKTVEDVERHRRLVTEYKSTPKPIPSRWDVTIRNYPPPGDGNWEDFSDVSSASGMTIASRSEPPMIPPQNYIGSTGPHLFSPELVGSIGTNGLPLLPELPPARNPLYTEEEGLSPLGVAEPVPVNWDVLIRVLRPEPQEEVEYHEHESLTIEERTRWRQIITSRSELRRALSECVVREDFQRISEDQRYNPLFPQHKWDVIIRILAPPQDKPKGGRYRKKSDWDTRSRRSSLPTLYEYDSDGGTSIRTPRAAAASPSQRTSRSSYRSDHVDMRSMSEMMVDYARMDGADSQSEVSLGMPLSTRFYDTDSDTEQDFRIPRTSSQRSLQRSLSQPSLVRSASEFTERWAAHEDDGDASDDEGTPRVVRRHMPDQAEHQHMATFTSTEVRTFQATKGWPRH